MEKFNKEKYIINQINKINKRLDELEQKSNNKLFTPDGKEIVEILWPNASINNMEWKDIANCKCLKVGDYKIVTLLSGEEVKVYLANLEPLRFIFAIDGEYRMNDANTNKGGWNSCRMKNVTMKHLWNLLPDNFKKHIVKHDSDLLSLMSEKEYNSFDIFKEKTLGDLFTGHCWYWLKTYSSNEPYYFSSVYSGGSILNSTANCHYGVSVCIAIK